MLGCDDLASGAIDATKSSVLSFLGSSESVSGFVGVGLWVRRSSVSLSLSLSLSLSARMGAISPLT